MAKNTNAAMTAVFVSSFVRKISVLSCMCFCTRGYQKLEGETRECQTTMENVWIQYSINVWVQLKTIKKAENLFQILGFVFSIRLPLFLLPRERGNFVPWL